MKKKLLSLLFAGTMVFGCAALAMAEDAAQMTGAYETYMEEGITEDAQEAFDLAMESFDGGENYTAVQLVETQLVAGMNYRILCDVKTEDGKTHKNLLTIYKDLNGNCEVMMEQKVIMPVNHCEVLDNSDFSVNAGFSAKDFDWENHTLRFEAFETAYYDMFAMSTLECGTVICSDGSYFTVESIEEGDTIRRNSEGGEEKAATCTINKDEAGEHRFMAYEGGTWVETLFDGTYQIMKLGERTLPFSDSLTFTDHTAEPGESIEVPFEELENYMADRDIWQETYYPGNTKLEVENGEIVSIVSTWRP